jgi:hypothetical protein
MENITPEQAHEIAYELCAERFDGFQVLIITHIDKNHIHNHIVINTVNVLNGNKLHERNCDLKSLKDRSNALCVEGGFSVCAKGEKTTHERTSFDSNTYHALRKGRTSDYSCYMLKCFYEVSSGFDLCVSREDFISRMKNRGYQTNWSDNRKHITFTNSDGFKVRASTLAKTFSSNNSFTKEEFEYSFRINKRRNDLEEAKRQEKKQEEAKQNKPIEPIKMVTPPMINRYDTDDSLFDDYFSKNEPELGIEYGG